MNIKYIYSCIVELQTVLNGNVTFSVQQFGGLQIRVYWFYKEKSIHWQYVISPSEMELINDNSAFVLYLIEKAKAEYQTKKMEIDTDDRT